MPATLLFLVLLAQQPPPPAPELEVVVAKVGKPGRYLAIKAKTEGATVLWRAIDPGIDFLDPELAPQDTRVTAVIADLPGKYRIIAVTALPDADPKKPPRPVVTEFVVTFEGPTPPGPTPPGPTPPTPPGPTPPAPTDPLAKALQDAYTRDAAQPSVKAAQKVAIVGLYLAMAEHAKDPSIATVGDLLSDLRKTGEAMLPPGALTECRKIIGAEVGAKLGTDKITLSLKLDPDLRPVATATFARIAKAMSEAK